MNELKTLSLHEQRDAMRRDWMLLMEELKKRNPRIFLALEDQETLWLVEVLTWQSFLKGIEIGKAASNA